jgi:type IV pilus assembly protein PilF
MTRIGIVLVCAWLAGCAGSNPKPADGTDGRANALQRARIHTELGTAYFDNGQTAIALDELRIAVEADPTYVPAHNQLGLVHMALGDDRLAQGAFERALKLDPNDSPTNNNFGLFLCQRKREKEAIRYFMVALKNPLYTTPENAYANAGICSRMQGDDVRGEEWLRKALALQPNQPQALYQLADIAFKKGDILNSRNLLARHLQVSQPSPEALWLGARIESRLGDKTALASYGAQLNNRFPAAQQTKAFNEGRFQ